MPTRLRLSPALIVALLGRPRRHRVPDRHDQRKLDREPFDRRRRTRGRRHNHAQGLLRAEAQLGDAEDGPAPRWSRADGQVREGQTSRS